METRRCTVHGLILGPDGRCVICRRGEEERKAATSSDLPVVAFAAVVGVAVILVLGYWLTRGVSQMMARDVPQAVATAPADDARALPPAPPATSPFPIRSDGDATPTAVALPDQPTTVEELEAAKRTVKIVLYTGDNCSLCSRAREFLAERNYNFQEINVDKSETDAILLKSLNPAGSVPTFDVEGKVLVGYNRSTLDKEITRVGKARLPH